ncbi:MAG: BamA/TamA family outer membrane protein [Bacteroidota bacterium]
MLAILPRYLLIAFSFLAFGNITAQGLIEKITDLLEFNLGPPPTDTAAFRPKVVVAPFAYFEPNTSFGFGLGAKLLFKPKGAGEDTRTSNIPIGLSYTLKNQVFFSSAYFVFFPEEKWLYRGNLDYSSFPQPYYGIGNQTSEADRIDITYNNFLFEGLLLRQVANQFFVGGGFRYNTFYKTRLENEALELPAGTSLQDSLGSKSVGLEFAITRDSRDNVLNPGEGTFAEFTQGFYGRVLDGTNTFQLSRLDMRKYKQLGSKGLIAGQLFARYAWNDAPVQELSQLGGAELMRGFIEGRFRDRLAVFAQAEYRWRTWERVGFVLFAGTGRVADGVDDLGIDALRYSIGTGLRILIVKSENLNLRFDYAFGLGESRDQGFYFGVGETF